MPRLYTLLGPLERADLGMILPHEHIFVDLRTPDTPGHGEADPADVVRLMAPEVERARAAGVTAIVDCGPVGVGRRADALRAVAEAARLPIVAPTGIYREPWVPAWAARAGEDELRDWMQGELEREVEGGGAPAGFIKVSAGDDGVTELEGRILRAAARAAAATGAAIGSHTIRGRVVHDQLDRIEAAGHAPSRFIWIHASADTLALNMEVARRGAWVEYDWVGSPGSDDDLVDRTLRMCEAGYAGQLLLSHDRGWYDPAKPGGGTPQPFTYLSEVFLPRLAAAGLGEGALRQLTHDNPFRAFAR